MPHPSHLVAILDKACEILRAEGVGPALAFIEAHRSQVRHPVNALVLEAEIRLAAGHYSEARALASQAIALNDQTPPFHSMYRALLGKICFVAGEYEAALIAYREAIHRNSSDSEALAGIRRTLAALARPRSDFSVTIITATTGRSHLLQAIESVQQQDYPNLEHIVVFDGTPPAPNLQAMATRHPLRLQATSFPTGKDGFNGHRIYGGYSLLCNGDYVAFLDDDNWMAPNHVSSLMTLITSRGLDWSYSLRMIHDSSGQPITADRCESLGQWPVWFNPSIHHIDTSCFMIRREIAVAECSHWHTRARTVNRFGSAGADTAFTQALLDHYPATLPSGHYTLHYRLGGNPRSVRASFFVRGNAASQQRYGGSYPWEAAANDPS